MLSSIGLVLVATQALSGVVVTDEEVTIAGHYLTLVFNPSKDGAIEQLQFNASGADLVPGDSMLLEGFGVGSVYVPNRRLNPTFEALDDTPGRAILRYRYDCDGPNITGLQATRTVEPFPNEASVRVTWTLENKGTEAQWVAPWVRSSVAPGGTVDAADRIDVPTLQGVQSPTDAVYVPASRNWIAATDPSSKQSIYAVFNADHVHSFLPLRGDKKQSCNFQTAFVPSRMQPGDTWETTYRLNVVRGLSRVDFASDELAMQFDYSPGTLTVLIAAARPLPQLTMEARVMAANGRVWRLPAKRFTAGPNKVVKATYPWEAIGDGSYEFLAQVKAGSEVFPLGGDTGSPHGGVDTVFTVGNASNGRMEPWTDAPFAMARQPRTMRRPMAVTGDTAIWFENSLEKVFREDVPQSTGRVDPIARLSLARNESESFQVVVRPPAEVAWVNLDAVAGDLSHQGSDAKIPASQITLSRVHYHDVPVPTHFEQASGAWPDALTTLAPFTASGGENTSLWVTVQAPAGIPAGVYTGALTLRASDRPPTELGLAVTVYDFDLPLQPTLKTDFGFWPQRAFEGSQALGYTGTANDLNGAYFDLALKHRITLRELAQFPAESADYAATLRAFEPHFKEMIARGATTFSVPVTLAEAPELLETANDFVKAHGQEGRVFAQIAVEPERPAWPRVFDRLQLWRKHAPDISTMITSAGLHPFLHEDLNVWAMHAPVFDTVNGRALLERITQGGEVWWYFNHSPPRPYGNLFIDFLGIEHRILFWQTWSLGLRGFHYWNVNYVPEGRDPWKTLADVVPTNGDGFLMYPTATGPAGSIRLANIRDGIDDYDYLVLLRRGIVKLESVRGQEGVKKRAKDAYNIGELVQSLVTFPRDPQVLINKRDEIARAIVAMRRAGVDL
jgi:hypothetical protein